MQNFRKSDAPAEKVVFATKIEGVIGGITISAADLVDNDIVPAGTVVGKDGVGLFHVLKTAKVLASAINTATDYHLSKGHNFKVGDFFASAVGAKSYAITSIVKTDPAHDVITLGTTLGVAVPAGATVFQALAESATTTSAFRITPHAVTGSTIQIKTDDINTVDAYLRASVFEVNAPAVTQAIKTALPHIMWL